jgi:hypothetical protein
VLAAGQQERKDSRLTGEAIVKIGRVRLRLDVDVVNLRLQLRLATAREAAVDFDGQHFLAVRASLKLAFRLLHPPSPCLRSPRLVNWNTVLWKGPVLLASRCLPNPPMSPALASPPQQPASDTFQRPYDQMVP